MIKIHFDKVGVLDCSDTGIGQMLDTWNVTYFLNKEGEVSRLLLDEVEERNYTVEDYRTVLDGKYVLTVGYFDINQRLLQRQEID